MARFPGFLSRWRRSAPDRRRLELQTQLTRTLELVVDREQLQSSIMGYLVDLCGAQHGVLYLWNADADRLQRVWPAAPAAAEAAVERAGDSHLVRWLQVNEEALAPGLRPDIVAGFGPAEQNLLHDLDAGV